MNETSSNRISRAGIPPEEIEPDGRAPTGPIRSASPSTIGIGCARRSQPPVDLTEGERARADRSLREHDERPDTEVTGVRVARERPEEQRIGHEHDDDRPTGVAEAEPALLPRPVEDLVSQRCEAPDHPVGQTEQAHLLGGGRLDREAIRISRPPLLLDGLL